MNSYDNIRHDISDASFSVNTAIELLSGIKDDGEKQNTALQELIGKLEHILSELEGVQDQVSEVEHQQPV